MSNFEELKDKVVRWAFERDLHQADPKIQRMREQALKDALDDDLVTLMLVVLATQFNLDLVKCLEIAYEEIKDRNEKMVNGTYVKTEDL